MYFYNKIGYLYSYFVILSKAVAATRKNLSQILRFTQNDKIKPINFVIKLVLLLILVINFQCNLQAQTPFVIYDETPLCYVGRYLLIFEDKQADLTINQILQAQYQKQFTPSLQETPNMNLTKSAIWSKFSVQNQTNEPAYLQINTGFLDDIKLYGIDANNKVKLIGHTGDRQPFISREWLITQFVFHLPKHYHTYYLRIKTKGMMLFPIKIGGLKKTVEYLHKWDMAQGFYLGLCFIILLYNVLIYRKIREKLYIIYCLYILAVIAATGQFSGLTFEWLWQDYPMINAYENIIYASAIVSVFFAAIFLKSAKYTPKLHKLLYFTSSLYIFAIVCNILGFHREANALVQIAVFANSVVIMIITLLVVMAGYKPASYFLVAWLFLLSSSIIFILTLVDILPANSFTINAIQIGSAIEMILLSAGIAQKISDIQVAKIEAETANVAILAQNEKLIKDQYVLLERKVQERTFQLYSTQEEMAAQNQELLQYQEEILAQKDLISEQKHNLQRQNDKISEGIKASFAIQKGILPSKEQLTKWLKEYFVFYKPKDIVSGDLYWFATWEDVDGNIKKISAAIDCTGHGVQGALTSMIARTLFDEVVLIKLQDNPAEILEEVNQKIHAIFDRENNNGYMTGMDVALTACTYTPDKTTVKVVFAGAKRPLLYVLPNTTTTITIQGSRKSIGGKQQKDFENHYLNLPINTMLYLCTDGFSDQNNSQRDNFGILVLKQMLGEIASKSISEQKEILQTTLQTFMQDTEQRDDILIF